MFSNDNATEPQVRIRAELAELLAVGLAAAALPPEASLREIMARGKTRQAQRQETTAALRLQKELLRAHAAGGGLSSLEEGGVAAPRSTQDAAAEGEAGRGRSNSLTDCQDYDWDQLWAGGMAGEWLTGEPGNRQGC